MLFTKQESTQAYLKAGIMGFAGAGKTYTATDIAVGLVRHLKAGALPEGDRPIFFLDTETGSDYVATKIRESGVELFTAKTRAFKDLIPAIEVALARQSELVALERSVTDLEARLRARKIVDRAKGRLMDEHGLDEQSAWRFIQTSAMHRRRDVGAVAQEIVDGELAPEPPVPPS